MRIVLAPNAFKGCLPAEAVAEALAEGLARALPQAELIRVPVADGGDGTASALVAAGGGAWHEATVSDPLGRPARARYGLLPDGSGVVEVAAAAGLALLRPQERDPLRTTTRGVGELLRRLVEVHGARRLVVGLGGSATCDGGAGLAQALGVRLLDGEGRELGPGGAALLGLDRIERGGGLLPREGVDLLGACDVDNPLCGPQGAAAVYAPQKGADAAGVATLEAALTRLADRLEAEGQAVRDLPGAGAAGGLGAGLAGFCGARLLPGADLVLEAVGLARRLQGARLVVTGEGRLDAQTTRNKAPWGVARLARAAGVPAVAVVGALEPGAALGDAFAAVLPLPDRPLTLEQALAEAPRLLVAAGERLGRLLALGAEPGPARPG